MKRKLIKIISFALLVVVGLSACNSNNGDSPKTTTTEQVSTGKRDILFMVLDGRIPDEGACVELGIAYASGKRCYGIKSDARSVEINMDLNPMISGCFSKIFSNLDGEKLIDMLKDYLKDNQL